MHRTQHDTSQNRPRLFGTNGIRGTFGVQLTSEISIDVSYSLAAYFGLGPIIVGYDGRKSSPILSKLVRSTINSAGLDVANAGLLPTPCLQFAVKRLGYKGGVMISASHNPPEYNGVKPIASDGVEISREDELIVEEFYYNKSFPNAARQGIEYPEESVLNFYLDQVLALVDVEKIRACNFTIAMDIGNGAQAVAAPFLAKRLGCKIITLNGRIDGDFPGRGPEPTLDNLAEVSNAVKDSRADMGVAYDGDGDRSIFCDEKGTVHWGDKTGTLLVKYLLESKLSGTQEIVCPINTSMLLSLVVMQAGSKLTYTKVGSVEVSREMVKRKCFLGLEENGGFMYGKLNEVRDGAMTTALVLDMLASNKSHSTLSQLIASLPMIFQFKTKFKCPTKEFAAEIIRKCIEHGSPKKIETLDGAKIWIDDETWIMVRPSGTEPIVRMYAESTDRQLLNSKVEDYSRLIENNIRSGHN